LVAEKGITISRACRVAQIDRKTYRYDPKQQKDNEMIKSLLLELSAEHPHYGFETLFGLLRNRGHVWNHKRVRRIYCDLKLNLKRKPKKRLAPRTQVKLVVPAHMNDTWSIDFMHDALACGRRFRTMNVIDDHRRECLGIKIAFSLPSTATTRHLDELAQQRGYPKVIRLDNGPEHIAQHFKEWADSHHITLRFIQPGKPSQNAYIERFNRSYREAILDMYLFDSLREVKQLTKNWIHHYNFERPHQALGMQPPIITAANSEQLNSLCKVG
jgi:putative transposase